MRKSRLTKYVAAFFSIAALAVILAVAVRSPRAGLLDRATRVSSVVGWNLYHASYHWISGSEVLYFRGDDTGGLTSGWTLMKRDLCAQSDEELTVLTKEFRDSYGSAFELTVSPDGKNLLWPCSQGCFSASVNGRRV